MALYLKNGNWFIDYRAKGRSIREKVGTSKVLAETVLKKRELAIAEGKFLDTKNGEKREVPMNEIVQKTIMGVLKNPESQYIFCKEDGKPYGKVRKSFCNRNIIMS